MGEAFVRHSYYPILAKCRMRFTGLADKMRTMVRLPEFRVRRWSGLGRRVRVIAGSERDFEVSAYAPSVQDAGLLPHVVVLAIPAAESPYKPRQEQNNRKGSA